MQLAAYVMQLAAYVMQLAAYVIQLAAYVMQLAAYVMQLAAYVMQLAAYVIQLAAYVMQHGLQLIPCWVVAHARVFVAPWTQGGMVFGIENRAAYTQAGLPLEVLALLKKTHGLPKPASRVVAQAHFYC
jgi:hypothetical protein